jgi:hypothetical protein
MKFGITKEEASDPGIWARRRGGVGQLIVIMGILVPKDPPAGGDVRGKETGVQVMGDCGKVQRTRDDGEKRAEIAQPPSL